MFSIIGVDWGLLHIGIALADPSTGLVIHFTKPVSNHEVIQTLQSLVDVHTSINRIVVGRPTTFSGKDTKVSVACDVFCSQLAHAFPQMRVMSTDERYSTKKALSKQFGITNANDPLSHHAAAAQILEDYLRFEYT